MNNRRRNYAFDNFRRNKLNQRKNVDEYFSRNFGANPRRSRRAASARASRNIKNINEPNQLNAPRSGINRNISNNNRLRNLSGMNNRGRGKLRLGRRNINAFNKNKKINNNNSSKIRGRNQQRRRENNQSKKLTNNNIKAKQNTQVKRVMRRNVGPIGKLELSNLSPEIMNKDLIEIFSIYGKLKRCAVLFQDNQSTGRGVVQYVSRANAQRAFTDLQGTCIKGSFITINYVGKKKKEENNNQINADADINMDVTN